MIKAYINMPYKKMGVLSVFEKKLSRETEKNPNFVYAGQRYAHQKLMNCLENVCLRSKFNLRLKKKGKIGGGKLM